MLGAAGGAFQGLRARLREIRGTPLHIAVWLVAAATLAFMLAGRMQRFEYIGIAQSLQYEVSAEVPGRVASLLVGVYEQVERGQIIARLDEAGVMAQLATAHAVIDQLAAESGAERARLGFQEADLVGGGRRFQIDEQRLRLDTLALGVGLEGDGIELERLNLQLHRAESLGREGILPQAELDDLRLQREVVARRIEENRKLLEETHRELTASRARREAYEDRFPVPNAARILEPLKEAVTAQERRVEELEIAHRALALRSPTAGRVIQVLARPGQYVLPGEPVAMILEQMPSEIIAYASERFAGRITQQARVLAARQDSSSVVAESVITRVGPGIELIPQRLWRDPALPEYGLPFVIADIAALRLKPGEMVTVRVLSNPLLRIF